MTATHTPDLIPQAAVDVLADVERYLHPAKMSDANGCTPTAQPATLDAHRHPLGRELVYSVDALENYAGHAIAGPVKAAAYTAATELAAETERGDYWRDAAARLDDRLTEAEARLRDVARTLEAVAGAYAEQLRNAVTAAERARRLEEYADLCASTGRMPTAARRAAVLREADKAADRRLEELARG